MGSEDGYIHFYDARSRLPLAQSCVDHKCPILGILHDQKTRLVYILLEIGIVYAVNDDISVELRSCRLGSVIIKLNVMEMYQVGNATTSCFEIVHNTNSEHEIWIGRNESITVLNAKSLKIICKLKVIKEHSSCIAHIAVTNAESNTELSYDQAAISSVFSAFYHGQTITQWDRRTKEIVKLLNINNLVNGVCITFMQ